MHAIKELEISPLDEHFARLLGRLGPCSEAVRRAASLLSAAVRAGHTCLPLALLQDGDEGGLTLSGELAKSTSVGAPGEWKPLILDAEGKLYLQRYWQYEQTLAKALLERQSSEEENDEGATWVAELLREMLPPQDGRNEQQREAARRALRSNFCIITGGPGTGKTRTVAVILALLLEEAARTGKEQPRILLTAPTGKAAARMIEALEAAFASTPILRKHAGKGLAPAQTLHRLLGLSADSALPRFNQDRPLSADAVILDEASMVDLALLTKLVAATPPSARLIILGDRHQLSSVEAGRVLDDLCRTGWRSVVELQHNFRFLGEGGIGALATAVNDGAADDALRILEKGTASGVLSHPLPGRAMMGRELSKVVTETLAGILKIKDPEHALAATHDFRILCALRKGPFGVESVNRQIESELARRGILQMEGEHYSGQPILITRNEYHLGLFNGDIGVLLADKNGGGTLKAFFPAPGGGVRAIHPARLPSHETVWAMSVHKSQGSEFNKVLLILPDKQSPLLTRELIYTGITRARSRVEIWYEKAVFRSAVMTRIERFSGLAAKLTRQGITQRDEPAAKATLCGERK